MCEFLKKNSFDGGYMTQGLQMNVALFSDFVRSDFLCFVQNG